MFLSVVMFQEGLHISHFIPEPGMPMSDDSRQLNEHLALAGVRAVCQMIFNDNFVHGDLHPGNILVQNLHGGEMPPKITLSDRLRHRWQVLVSCTG